MTFKAGEWVIYAPEGTVREAWLQRVGKRFLVLEDEQPGFDVLLYREDTDLITVKAGNLRHEVTLNHAYQAVLRRIEVGRATYSERSLALLRQCLSYLETVAQTQQTWLAPYDSAPVLEPIREEIDKALSEADAIRTR